MYAAVLTHANRGLIEKCEKTLWNIGEVLCEDDLTPEHFERALRKIPCGRRKLEKPLTINVLDAIRSVIDPEIIIRDEDENALGILTVAQEKFIHEPIKVMSNTTVQKALPLDLLNEETNQIAENTSVRLLRGVAGSGKSLVLARRAQYLAQQHPDLSILVIAFNVDLVNDLERRIQGAKNLEITNFHKLCAKILGSQWRSPSDLQGWLTAKVKSTLEQNNFTANFVASEIEWRKEFGIIDNNHYLTVDRKGRGNRLTADCRTIINQIFDQYLRAKTNEDLLDWSDVPFQTLDALIKNHPLQHCYDAILIDEAQDFAPSWLSVIKELLKPDGLLFMCDDPTQSIFRFYSWKEKGIPVQGRTRHLRVPFRSTREITLAAHSLINTEINTGQQDEIIRPDFDTYELPAGTLPQLMRLKNERDEINFIENAVKKSLNEGVKANQIAILCHHKSIIKHWAYLRSKGIYVEHFNKMKGLEFEVVYLPQVHSIFSGSPSTQENLDNEFYETKYRSIFTAMTRARQKLVLTYHGTFPSELAAMEPYLETPFI